jgi:predicted DNA repair protein MutK
MAAASLLALIDDIASILDDVAVMSKVAAKKTAGVLGDDLALNAQQVSGVNADRELPVVWAVAVGSLRNKAILVPAALAISALLPWAITPLLMIGGAYLCFEGVEKIAHSLLHKNAHGDEPVQAEALPEREKVQGAIRTDFILSAEIIVIALGTVANAPFAQQIAVLVAVALLMTVGVDGFVALIVKLDDAGLYLSQRGAAALRGVGNALLWLAPWLMRSLSVVGTLAMFLVGGSIVLHGLPGAHHLIEHVSEQVDALPHAGMLLAPLTGTVINAVAGILIGVIVLTCVTLGQRVASAVRK